MGIDTTTILKYFSGSIFVIVLLFLFYLYTSKRKSWFTISYLIGKVLQLIALAGIILRDKLPDILSIDLSAILLIASYSFEVYSIISYDGKIRRKILTFLIASFIVSSIIFTLFSYHEAYRSLISSFSSAIIFCIGGIDLFMFRRKLKFPILLGVVFFSYCFIQLFRGSIILLNIDTFQLQPTSPTDSVFYIIAFIYLTMSSVGFLLLMKEYDEELFLLKNKVLKETTLSKNKLFSIIAHDLKSPIAAMASIGQILLEQHNKLTPEQREEIINDITKSSNETFNLLNNLLLWTQSETGVLKAKFESVNLNNLVKENIRLVHNALENKKIETIINLNENTTALADKNMINTIIRNILSNAIKFTEKDGIIRIATLLNNNNTVSISISDSGIGIKSETLENLFNLNPEHNNKGTNKEAGTGLGLKLCKEFIDKNNGNIYIESKLGSGSTFTITLPGSAINK